MVNPYHSPLAMQGKGGGRKVKRPKPASTPGISSRGPKRNTMPGAKPVKQFPKSEGI